MKRIHLAALLCAIAFLGVGSCASTGIDYPYYVVHPETDELYAKEQKDDLPLDKTCTPDPECSQPNPPKTANCAKCIAMINAQYFQMKQELLELRKALATCQKGPQPQ